MGTPNYLKNSLLFDKDLEKIIGKTQLNIIDIGASGNLCEPWKNLENLFPQRIKVTGFEPDPDEFQKLVQNHPNRLYINKALWKEKAVIPFHTTMDPSCSGAFPVNEEMNSHYPQENMLHRQPKEQIEIEASTLDAELSSLNWTPDFIKIDTQGSEYEILQGGQFLAKKTLGFTLECWTREIHKNQKLAGEVMCLMDRYSQWLFNFQIAGPWKHKTQTSKVYGLKQPVGLDFLYLADYQPIKDKEKLIKLILLADLWGFPDYAIHICENRDSIVGSEESSQLIKRISSLKKGRFLGKKALQESLLFMQRKSQNTPLFPPIHD